MKKVSLSIQSLLFLMVVGTYQAADAAEALATKTLTHGWSEFLYASAGPSGSSTAKIVEPDPNKYFGKANAWYESGQDVKWTDVKGYWVGRCFSFDDQDKAANGMFGYLPSAAGPGFPGEAPLFDVVHRFREPAGSLDSLENYDQVIVEFQKAILGQQHYSDMADVPTLSLKYDIEPNNRPDFEYRVRVSGTNLVWRMTNLIAQNLKVGTMKSPRYVAAGQIMFTCYFFKKVAD